MIIIYRMQMPDTLYLRLQLWSDFIVAYNVGQQVKGDTHVP
jgi:hypothetical protein